MRHNKNCQISGPIIRPVMEQILATDGTFWAHAQIIFEQRALATIWAFAAPAKPHRTPNWERVGLEYRVWHLNSSRRRGFAFATFLSFGGEQMSLRLCVAIFFKLSNGNLMLLRLKYIAIWWTVRSHPFLGELNVT